MRKLPLLGVAALLTASAAWAQPQQGPQATQQRVNIQYTPTMKSQGVENTPVTTETIKTVEVLRPVMETSTPSLHWQYFQHGFHPELMPADPTLETHTHIETVTPQNDINIQRPIMESPYDEGIMIEEQPIIQRPIEEDTINTHAVQQNDMIITPLHLDETTTTTDIQ